MMHLQAPVFSPITRPIQFSFFPKGLLMFLILSRGRVSRGEALDMTLLKYNTAGLPITLNYTTTQRYDFLIHDMFGRKMWQWSDERFFAQVLGIDVIPPGSFRVYRERFIIPAIFPSGRYRLYGWNTAAELANQFLAVDFIVL